MDKRSELEKALRELGRKEPSTMETLGKLFVGLLSFAIAVGVKGLVVLLMWGWFIQPLGLPSLSFPMALGFGLFVSIFKDTPKGDKKKASFKEMMEQMWRDILTNLLGLLIGFIVSLFL